MSTTPITINPARMASLIEVNQSERPSAFLQCEGGQKCEILEEGWWEQIVDLHAALYTDVSWREGQVCMDKVSVFVLLAPLRIVHCCALYENEVVKKIQFIGVPYLKSAQDSLTPSKYDFSIILGHLFRQMFFPSSNSSILVTSPVTCAWESYYMPDDNVALCSTFTALYTSFYSTSRYSNPKLILFY